MAPREKIKGGRWIKRYLECDRPWEAVDEFYATAVRHKASDPILNLVPEELRDRLYRTDADASSSAAAAAPALRASGGVKSKQRQPRQRNTWMVKIGYYGTPLVGYAWQKEEPERTVEGLLQQALGSMIDKLVVSCAGRTDKGVHAVGQVCSFYSWKGLDEQDILQAIQDVNENVVSYDICKVPRSFHATFSCCWRHYMYILPKRRSSCSPSSNQSPDDDGDYGIPVVNDGNLKVEHLRQLLKALEGKELPYGSFSRDIGDKKSIDCVMHFCDVSEATVEGGVGVYVIHLVGNRFLKRMVRILVSTLVHEAIILSNDQREGDYSTHKYRRMVELAEAGDKMLTQTAAPPVGLCMVGVGYHPYPEV